MNQLRFLRLALLLPALITVGCGEAGNDEGDKQIELPDKTEETQQAFADEETTGGFTFTAKQSWTATVTEGKATRAGNVDWLRLLYEGEEKYSGAAGTFTLVIELDENYSGKTRTATITISAGTSKITVTVTQDGKTEDGEIPEQEPNGSGGIGIPPAGSRLISKITVSGDNTGSIDFTYDSDNRLIGIEAETTDNEGVYSNITLSYNKVESGAEPSYAVTVDFLSIYEGDSDRYTATYHTLGDNGYLSSGDEIYEYEDGPDHNPWTGTYNNAGYLIRSTWNGDTADGDYFYDVIWTGGNLTRLHSGEEESVTDFEYADIANNPLCNLDLNYLFAGDWINPFAAMVGLFGKRSANMVSKETMSYYDTPDTEVFYTATYTYETDSDGFVTKITVTDSEDQSDAYNAVYTIAYR